MKRSSSLVHSRLTISGLSTLCHLSRHYRPSLPVKNLAIITQFYMPNWATFILSNSSSSGVHYELAYPRDIDSRLLCSSILDSSGKFLSSRNRLKHRISVLWGINLQSLCQDQSPYIWTRRKSSASQTNMKNQWGILKNLPLYWSN